MRSWIDIIQKGWGIGTFTFYSNCWRIGN